MAESITNPQQKELSQEEKAFQQQVYNLHRSAGFSNYSKSKSNEYYEGLTKTAEETPEVFVGDTSREAANRVYRRFRTRTNPDEIKVRRIGENLGLENIGLLAFDNESPDFMVGTLGFHAANVTANMAGGFHELATTNQNANYSQTNVAFNNDLFIKSTAYEPEKKLVDKYRTVIANDKSGSYYIKEDGSPLTLDSNLIQVDPKYMSSNVVGPNTVVGEGPEGTLILAKDRMPQEYRIVDPGLSALNLTEYERSYLNYNTAAVNNFGRFWRIGDYGPADRTVLGFIDTSVIPMVDSIEAMISPSSVNPAVVAQQNSPKINAVELISTIQRRDPDLYITMQREGVDFNVLASKKTAAEFRAYVNGTFQKNAIARALAITRATNSWWEYKAKEGLFMVYGTLTSGDAVAQAGITIATIGSNLTVSGGLNASARAAVVGGSVTQRVASTGVAVSRNIERAMAFSRGMNTITRYMPVNLPNTLIEFGLQKLPNLSSRLAGSSRWVRWPTRTGLWVGGQAIEGFIEEGVTDALNQGLELSYGLRSSYNFGQTMDQAWVGALMEPVLGGVLMPGFIGVNWSTNITMNSIINRVPSMIGISSARVNAFNNFLSATQGNWNDLSPLQKKQRELFITRSLIVEQTLGRYTFGKFAKAETTMQRLAELGLKTQSSNGPLSNTDFVEAGFHLATFMENLTNMYVTNSQQDADKIKLINQGLEQGILKVEDGNIKLAEQETEFALVLLASNVFGESRSETQNNYVLQRLAEIKEQRLEEDAKDLFKELAEAEKNGNSEKTQEIKKQIEQKRQEIDDDLDFERTKTQELIDRFNLFRSIATDNDLNTSGQFISTTTQDAVRRAGDRMDERLKETNQRIGKALQKAGISLEEPATTTPKATVTPEAAPAAPTASETVPVAPTPQEAALVAPTAPEVATAVPTAPEAAAAPEVPTTTKVTEAETKDLLDRFEKLWDDNKTSDAEAYRILFNNDKSQFLGYIKIVLQSSNSTEQTINLLDGFAMMVLDGKEDIARIAVTSLTKKPC